MSEAVAPSVETIQADLVVVGAGPAGLTAAAAAGSAGLKVVILDETLRPGGQIWRHLPGEEPPEARRLLAALAAPGIQTRSGVSVFDAWREETTWHLVASGPGGRLAVRRRAGGPGLRCPGGVCALPRLDAARRAGGRRRPGGAQGGAGPPGRADPGGRQRPACCCRCAATALEHGARLLGVLEQAPWSRQFGMAPVLASRPGKIRQALSLGWALLGRPYRSGWWVKEGRGRRAAGDRGHHRRPAGEGARVPLAVLRPGPGCRTWSWAASWAAPWTAPRWVADDGQRTSQPGVFAAGEVCGVAGVDAALAEGRIAGLAAADIWNPSTPEGRALVRARRRARDFGEKLLELYQPPQGGAGAAPS